MDEESTGFYSKGVRDAMAPGRPKDDPRMLQNSWTCAPPREWAIHIHLTSGEVSFQGLTYDEAEATLEAINAALAGTESFCKLTALTFALRAFSHAHLKKMPGEPKRRPWHWLLG